MTGSRKTRLLEQNLVLSLQLNLYLQYKISNKMLLVYKYIQSFYYLSVKSDALNSALSKLSLLPYFSLFFLIEQSLRAVFLDTTYYGFEFLTSITRV